MNFFKRKKRIVTVEETVTGSSLTTAEDIKSEKISEMPERPEDSATESKEGLAKV